METYNLEHVSRLGFPITLTPNDSTFDDIAIHAKLRQGLSDSTIDKNLRYAKFAINHPSPVKLFPPEYVNFVRHLDYRQEIEHASPHALKHEKKMVNMFLRAFGMPIWEIKLPTAPKSRVRILPFPNIVHKFFTYPYSKNRDENIVMQYLFFHGFLIGPRTPSELCEMKIDDAIFNDDGTGYLIITETKKSKAQRTLIPEKEIMTDHRRKSYKNWVDHWRPKYVTQHSGENLYIQPSSGKPYTVRHLGHKLSIYGKLVWKHFKPYDMRHWSCTARLIQQKMLTGGFDVFPVKDWHGHDQIETTMLYLRYAQQYYRQAPYDWIKRVLKYHEELVEENTLGSNSIKSINSQNTLVSNGNPSRDENGLEETYIGLQKEKKSINHHLDVLLISQPNLNLFSFIFYNLYNMRRAS